MVIRKLKLKNFRCFSSCSFDFNSKIVFIEGKNGSGKTSLLEALYYACFLRSFRTFSGRNLINFGEDHFFISVGFEEENGVEGCSQIQVGFSKESKLVKLNQSSVNSYKEIIDHYKILGATEEDLQLIKGPPEIRRSFLNQALFLESVDFMFKIKKYRQVLGNRNSFLLDNNEKLKDERLAELAVWSKQLWNCTVEIQEVREKYLKLLENSVNKFLKQYFDSDFFVKLKYIAKNSFSKDFDTFWAVYKEKSLNDELKLKRSLFGVHLDDFSIDFKGKKAKFYASRGQQKLVVFLIKIAQLNILSGRNKTVCFVLDDFLTDFDVDLLKSCLQILDQLKVQTFLTCPLSLFSIAQGIIEKIPNFKAQILHL